MAKFKWSDILSDKRVKEYKVTRETYDARTDFENDYERILFSASFRRLQDKAQVFPLEKEDFVRTRLTHSFEVSAIAKSLGRSIGNELIEKTKEYEDKVDLNMVNDICEVLSCAGLIHDLGNPPFGHFGETAIREWFEDKLFKNEDGSYTFNFEKHTFKLTEQEALDFMNFEGNAQVLRILTKLHFIIDKNGMNLTSAVLNSIIKYPVSSTNIDKSKISSKKLGYFAAEKEIFKEITENTKLYSDRNPLVYVLEAADDIAYLLGDLEDAHNKNIVTYDVLYNRYKNFVEENNFKEKTIEESLLYYLKKNYEFARDEYGYGEPGEYAIRSFIIKLKRYLRDVAVEEFINSYDKIMNGEYNGELLAGSKASKVAKFLRKIISDYVHTNEDIISREIVGYNMIHKMLDIFVPIVLEDEIKINKGYEGKIYSLISSNYRLICEDSIKGGKQSKEYYKLLLVTDFICGMTDSYALSTYKTLNGINI